MMSCKAPPPMPLRPAMGKGLLRADTTLVLSLGQSRRPPHSARGASMLAHDGSTSTPTATATALALAMVLAFAPMGDAKAAVGVCEGMSPLRSIGCQRAVEAEAQTKVHQEARQAVLQEVDAAVGVCQGMLPQRAIVCFEAIEASKSSKQHVSSGGPVGSGSELRAPKQRAQAAGQRLDTEQEVKALQARVATLEKERDQTISSNLETETEMLIFITGFLCNIALGYALVAVGIPQPDAAIIQVISYLLFANAGYYLRPVEDCQSRFLQNS